MPAQLPGGAPDLLFYDGRCGLCHRGVRFVLKHDRTAAFRFAPLQGETFRAAVPGGLRDGLPDSIIVLTAAGELLVRSDATLHILRRLGHAWGMLAILLSALPRSLRDRAYDLVAGFRYRLFGRRDELCPDVPPRWRERFDA